DAARIREVDQACIRWLGRQPGRSLIQKAGARQQLMAVTRKEDCDTPENRVVKDLLQRCKAAGRAYLARNSEFPEHKRTINVQRLVSLCEKHLRESQLKSVGKLVGVPQPNYVLQHESRYRVLWDAYLRLVRQETVLQSVWQWRDRVWSEWLSIALLSAMKRSGFRSPGLRQGIIFSDEPQNGRYVSSCTFGPWWSKGNDDELYLTMAGDLDDSPLPSWVKELKPDLAIVSGKQHIAIWTALDVLDPSGTALKLAEDLLDSCTAVTNCKLLVVVGGSRKFQRGNHMKQVTWLTVPLMVQDSIEEWQQGIAEMLINA
ncbi:DUF2357 domain-containing protein, partial [bacterium]|nr:DUF2357 domain-containing protein [bacterium]